MKETRINPRRDAFTLIELMVVVAIIGILVGALLPAFTAIRTKARTTQAAAQLSALDNGIGLFQGEFGNALPPSASDNANDRQIIRNPKENRTDSFNNGGASEVRISGAQLLVHAMVGADGLGTPGFKDFGTGSNGRDGLWWNDTHDDPADPYGAYAINPADGNEYRRRYGGTAGYVDDKMKDNAKTIADLVDKGVILNIDCGSPPNAIACDEAMFVDAWSHPILYYKASKGSKRITADLNASRAGVYRQQDNGVITGTDGGGQALEGLDFGPGKFDPNMPYYHPIGDAVSPDATVPVAAILVDPVYQYAFARFILNPSTTARPTPVRSNSYLLISAGPDGFYGTNDDVTNWTRDVQ